MLRGETLDHLLMQCPYSRGVRFNVLRRHGLQRILPSATATITDWWPAAAASVPAKLQKELNSMLLLITSSLWTERNARVFDGVFSTAGTLQGHILDEWRSWMICRRGPTRGIG